MNQTNQKTNKTTIGLSLIALTLFIAAYYPVLKVLAAKWISSQDYNYAFLVLPVIFYMAWKKKSILTGRQPRYSWIGLVIVVMAVPIYYVAMFTQLRTFISLSMVLSILGLLIYFFGINAVSEMITPLILLIMLIPVPDQLYIKLTFPLQLFVSKLSAIIINTLGIPILRQGNVMHIPNKSFEVIEACSGMHSLIALITLSIIMGYFGLQKKINKFLILVSTIPMAILINIIRVTGMILVFYLFRLDLTEEPLHMAVGIVTFVLALLILFFLQKVMASWETKQQSSY